MITVWPSCQVMREGCGCRGGKTPGKVTGGNWVQRSRGVAVRCAIGLSEDGGSCRERLRLRDASQTETDNQSGHSVRRAHAGAATAERPLQETEVNVQVLRFRFRGRPRTLYESIPGSDGGVSTAAKRGAAVHLVHTVRRHRLQNPEREGGALSSVQKLGSTAASRAFSNICDDHVVVIQECHTIECLKPA